MGIEYGKAVPLMRWNMPHGVNGPKVLQQMWSITSDSGYGGTVKNEWRDVPIHIPTSEVDE